MRFAYIDSHGNEVPIPSVDALALRIELGAIRPDTELYDAQADRWGPAESHEIFHTLSRDAEGDAFVAPPPVAPRPPAPDEGVGPRAAEPEPPAPEEEDEEQEQDTSFGLTLAAPPQDEPASEARPAPPQREPGSEARPAPPEAGAATTDLPLLEPDSVRRSEPPAPAAATEGGFDFGDLSGGLELEPTSLESTPLDASPADQRTGGLDLSGPTAAGQSAAGGGAQAGGPGDGGLELERPLSEHTPSPGWMEPESPGGNEGVMDFSPAPTQEADDASAPGGLGGRTDEAGAPAREPPQRKRSAKRPSRPKRRLVRSVAGPIVSVMVLAAAGVGAYVSWPILSERLGLEIEPPRPPVVIPDVPADLVPLMRELGDRALSETFAEMDERTATPDVPAQPPEDWLFGVYLANASRFEGVPAFWSGMKGFMAGLREGERQLFHVRYLEAAKAELAGDTVMMLTERADSGFVAATAAREDIYRRMDDLIEAALTLHTFLVENEQGIAYEPAALGVSGDPLLEAVPESEEVRVAMWDLLEELTNALDVLGTLDLVTRQELLDILVERVRGVAIQ